MPTTSCSISFRTCTRTGFSPLQCFGILSCHSIETVPEDTLPLFSSFLPSSERAQIAYELQNTKGILSCSQRGPATWPTKAARPPTTTTSNPLLRPTHTSSTRHSRKATTTTGPPSATMYLRHTLLQSQTRRVRRRRTTSCSLSRNQNGMTSGLGSCSWLPVPASSPCRGYLFRAIVSPRLHDHP